jgi:predicted ester cyclase
VRENDSNNMRFQLLRFYNDVSKIRVNASAMMVNGNFVSCPVEFSAKSGSKSVEMSGNDLYEVVNGKIVQVWLFSEDQPKEDEFWGK